MMLVRTPSPVETESLLGYVLRVSEANGYESPWHVFHLAGLNQGQMLSPRLPIEGLARILGKETSILRQIAYCTGAEKDSSYKILQHGLGKGATEAHLRLRRPAICPLCVQEKGYVEAFWDLDVAIACPDHHCLPVWTCPSCAEPIKWFRPGLIRCRCGCTLEAANPTIAHSSTGEFMGLLRAKLYSQSLSGMPNTAGFPVVFLEKMPLLALMRMLDCLGMHHLRAKGQEATEVSEVIASAVEPLCDWPRGYYQFLSILGGSLQETGLESSGLRGQFDPFYSAMFKVKSLSGHTEFLREEFVNFGLQHWGNSFVDKKLLRSAEMTTERRYISKTEYASRFGLWKPTLERMMADGTIVSKTVRTARGLRTVVDLKHTQPPVQSQGIVNDREAARRLGVTVNVLQYLRRVGVYSTKPRVGFEQSWHLDDVLAFRQRGFLLVKATDSVKATVKLGDVMRGKLRNPAAKGEVVRAIFEGRISVVGRDDKDLAGLILDKAQVDEIIHEKLRENEGATYTIFRAAKRIGLDPVAVRGAIEKGLLEAVVVDGQQRILTSSVDLFNRKYKALSEIANGLGTSSRGLRQFCRKQGFEVLNLQFGEKVSGQPILERDFEDAVIHAWKKDEAAALQKSIEFRRDAKISALGAYLQGLLDRGEPLPHRAGIPNKLLIAKACGFDRSVLDLNAEAKRMLSTFVVSQSLLKPIPALRRYLSELHERREQLPLRDGRPNKLAIARACGFHRNVLYTNVEALSLLSSFVFQQR